MHQNTSYQSEVYALENQVELIDRLMQRRGISPFIWRVARWAGRLPLLYAASHPRSRSPRWLLSAVRWASAGGPEPVRQAIVSGVNPFIPLNREQLDRELRLLAACSGPAVRCQTGADRALRPSSVHYRQVLGHRQPSTAMRCVRCRRIGCRRSSPGGTRDQVFDVGGAQALIEKYPQNRPVSR